MSLLALGGALLGGAASYFGQKETNSANKEMTQQTNDANVELARQNREWQERMANTAHEREVADLKKAGLNPILTATGGSGAATPSGSVATMQAAKMENALGAGVSSALASANLQKDLEMADSQKALNSATVELQNTQQDVNTSNAMKLREDTIKTAQENNIKTPALAIMRDAQMQQAQADLKTAKINNQMATFDAFNTRVKNGLETGSTAIDMLKPWKGLFNSSKSEALGSSKLPTGKNGYTIQRPNGTTIRVPRE